MTNCAIAQCFGAISVINAIATGKGAALGIDLWTKAEVKLTDEPGVIEGGILSDPEESSVLIKKIVKNSLKFLELDGQFGAKVRTWSNIPVARGLKSSSVAANAITLATIAASKMSLDDLTVVNIGIDGAIDANVTITGAFDDAYASYFGGLVIADNTRRKISKRIELLQDLTILIHIPPEKCYTSNLDIRRVKNIAPLVEIAYNKISEGEYWVGLTLNGLIYSSALGYDSSIALDALMAGALAAGLSGTGPSVAAVVQNEAVDSVQDIWQSYEGKILQTRVNHEKAKILD